MSSVLPNISLISDSESFSEQLLLISVPLIFIVIILNFVFSMIFVIKNKGATHKGLIFHNTNILVSFLNLIAIVISSLVLGTIGDALNIDTNDLTSAYIVRTGVILALNLALIAFGYRLKRDSDLKEAGTRRLYANALITQPFMVSAIIACIIMGSLLFI